MRKLLLPYVNLTKNFAFRGRNPYLDASIQVDRIQIYICYELALPGIRIPMWTPRFKWSEFICKMNIIRPSRHPNPYVDASIQVDRNQI